MIGRNSRLYEIPRKLLKKIKWDNKQDKKCRLKEAIFSIEYTYETPCPSRGRKSSMIILCSSWKKQKKRKKKKKVQSPYNDVTTTKRQIYGLKETRNSFHIYWHLAQTQSWMIPTRDGRRDYYRPRGYSQKWYRWQCIFGEAYDSDNAITARGSHLLNTVRCGWWAGTAISSKKTSQCSFLRRASFNCYYSVKAGKWGKNKTSSFWDSLMEKMFPFKLKFIDKTVSFFCVLTGIKIIFGLRFHQTA